VAPRLPGRNLPFSGTARLVVNLARGLGGDRRRSVLMSSILAVPYPMGFFAKGVDGGIDNPRTRLGTLGDLQEPEACACGDVVSHRSPYHHFVSNETSSVSRVPAPR